MSITKISISRIEDFTKKIKAIKKLSKDQNQAYLSIEKNFKQKDVCLLHGVTSSGKTEIYIKLIQKEINKGKQVL